MAKELQGCISVMRDVVLAGVFALLLSAVPGPAAFAEEAAAAGGEAAAAAGTLPEEPERFESSGSLELGTQTVRYRAIAGETFLRDDKDKPTASVFSITYLKEGVADSDQRPVTFVFNGGPGSASLWLHMGAWGPKRVVTPSDASDVGAPPYPIVDNAHSLLDVSDLVFIDPVGTGYSRALGETDPKTFWGVDEDAESVAEFIRLWITEHKRWNSPKYLAGESYGTTRAAAVTEKLQGGWNGIAVNGVILVSAILDFQTARFAPGNDTAHLAFFPTLATTAWHHGRVSRDDWDDVEAFAEAARDFAIDVLAPALIRGNRIDAPTQRGLAEAMSQFIGVSPDWILRANLRVDPTRFRKELLRDEGLHVGRFDSRYTGVDPEFISDTPENDPSGYGIDVAYVAAVNSYLGRDLKVDWTREYRVLTSDPGRNWNWTGERGWPAYVNVAPHLGKGMRENSELRVLLASGWYDLATPFFGAEMAFMKNGVLPERVVYTYYDAGHMMYLVEDEAAQLSEDVRDFIRAGSDE